nr:hypothetical protein [Collinsella sp. D33t1_170424_A12]
MRYVVVFIDKDDAVLDGLKVALPVSPGKNAARHVAVDNHPAALAELLILSDKVDKRRFTCSAFALQNRYISTNRQLDLKLIVANGKRMLSPHAKSPLRQSAAINTSSSMVWVISPVLATRAVNLRLPKSIM